MLFLFENTLTHYIYSILNLDKPGAPRSQYGQLLCYEQTRHTDRHTSPRSEQPHAHEQPHPDGIRAHNDRRALANEPGNIHTHEQPHPEQHPRANTYRKTITLPGFRIYDKPKLTASIPMGNSWTAAHL